MGVWLHRLSDVNESSAMALCANCGPVSVYRRSNGRFVCRIARNEHKGKRTHGLSDRQARAMKEGAECEICGSTEKLVIDHCHDSKRVRGVLCHWCNVAIGMMKDEPDRLRNAADYLDKSSRPPGGV